MITIVLGGQFGDEGKGSVVEWLAKTRDYDLFVRNGSINASHSVIDRQGQKVGMRQLSAGWVASDTPIYIPAGAIVSLEFLAHEVLMLRQQGYKGKIIVSPQAAVITPEARSLSKQNESLGSTMEGVGATRAAKCLRKAPLVRDFFPYLGNPVSVNLDGLSLVEKIYNDPFAHILIETTQGFGLSQDYKFYPHCTSTNLTPYHALAEAGVPFGVHKVEVWLVIRPHTVRFPGTSGKLLEETTWETMRSELGEHVPADMRSLDGLLYRVGAWDAHIVKAAINWCRPTTLVMTHVDYNFPFIKDSGVSEEISNWVHTYEIDIGREIDYLGVEQGELICRKFTKL